MMFAKHSLVALLPFYIAAVNAANDWSVPCTGGICEWDVEGGDTSGNVIVSAATSALSDITPAAGWHIIDCDRTSLGQQTIRLVCESADGDEAGCDALHEDGAENTIVRLPNSCGGGPFARLARIWESPDQSIPDEARRKFRKRSTVAPGTVQNAIIDFDFAAVPPGKDVDMLTTGSNHPDAPASEEAGRIRRAYRSQKMRRAVLKKPRPTPKPDGKSAATVVAEFLDKLSSLNKAGVTKNGGFPANVKKTAFSIAKGQLGCEKTATTPAINVALDINVDMDIAGIVTYGFVVQGKIVPPKLDDVGYFASFNGNASAVFHISATAEAEVGTGRIEVVDIPMSPLSVPGIVNIGPKFSVGLAASAKLGLTGKMDIGTTLALGNIEMRFPKTAGTSTGKALAKDGPLKLQVTPQIGLGGVFEGHVTPRIALGVDMISGLAKAEVFMEIDGKGSLDLGIQVAKTVGAPGTNVTGCIGLNAGITARAGAEGSVFPFFSKTANFDFFTKEFELFKKCFQRGSAAPPPTLGEKASPNAPKATIPVSKLASKAATAAPKPTAAGPKAASPKADPPQAAPKKAAPPNAATPKAATPKAATPKAAVPKPKAATPKAAAPKLKAAVPKATRSLGSLGSLQKRETTLTCPAVVSALLSLVNKP